MSQRRPRVPHAQKAEQARAAAATRAQEEAEQAEQEAEETFSASRKLHQEAVADGEDVVEFSGQSGSTKSAPQQPRSRKTRRPVRSAAAQNAKATNEPGLSRSEKRAERAKQRDLRQAEARERLQARTRDTAERQAKLEKRQAEARTHPVQKPQGKEARNKAGAKRRLTERAALEGAIRDTGTQPSEPRRSPAANAPVPARSLSIRVIILTLVLVISAVTLFPALSTLGHQSADLNEARTEIAKAQAEEKQLTRELQRWDDPEYVKQQARDRINVYMPGEKLYVPVGKPKDTKAPATNDPSGYRQGLPWAEGLWDSAVALSQRPTEHSSDASSSKENNPS